MQTESMEQHWISSDMYVFGQLLNGFGSGEKSTKFENMNKQLILLLLVVGLIQLTAFSQTVPFEQEVRHISARIDSLGWEKGGTVFTGSSTIRMWKSLEPSFPNENILNTGFGGSKASDLETHLFPLVIRLQPSRVFIYEGDNDIWAGVEVADIMTSLDNIVNRLQLIDPTMEIYLIGAKPSPSRWEKKANYEVLNQKLKEYSLSKEGVEFIDTWAALIDAEGNPRPELFLEDQLHLNENGYELWTRIFKSYF
ncbi:GDSL-type esterase/lipase family protein [Algoriphagus boritolerans]|nr:GDSL-type esterase/lipase family protein [Algoriphagus boritolerans]